MSPDAGNAVFEAVGAVFTWRNALQLYRDGEVRGVYWPTSMFFTSWGLWNIWYYQAIGQPLSFVAGLFLCAGNVAWVSQAIRLALRKA